MEHRGGNVPEKRQKMAKNRLDWFKLDCQCDDKIELIEAEFGLKGFAIVIKLYQKIYGGEGYYCKWDADVAMLFARKIGAGDNVVSEVIKKSIQRGIFDKDMFEKQGILTSHGIQKRYYECTERRKFSTIRPEYLLLECAHTTVNADISGGNADIPEENADISSTEKRRKEKNRTEEKREAETSSPMTALEADYGKDIVDRYAERVREWYSRNGRPVKDLAGTVRRWLENDGVKKADPNIEKYKCVINRF